MECKGDKAVERMPSAKGHRDAARSLRGRTWSIKQRRAENHRERHRQRGQHPAGGGRSEVGGQRRRTGHARVLGVMELPDIVKGGMRARFDQLQPMGIRTIMITGDNPLTAAAMAEGSRRQ